MRKTQIQIFYDEQRKIGEANEIFMEMQKSDHPITKEEFEKLMLLNPDLWRRFAAFFK